MSAPIEVRRCRNGWILTPVTPRDCNFTCLDSHVFEKFETLVAYLKDYYGEVNSQSGTARLYP